MEGTKNEHSDLKGSSDESIDQFDTSIDQPTEEPETPLIESIEEAYFLTEYDDDYDEVIVVHPSGSVLTPSKNPYNKLKKIQEANSALFKGRAPRPSRDKSKPKIKFNETVCVYEHRSAEDCPPSEMASNSPDSEKELMGEIHNWPLDESASPDIRSRHETSQSSSSNHEDENNSSFENNVKGINQKVLLVMVPNMVEEPINTHSDNSSESENEDVCVGHSRDTNKEAFEEIVPDNNDEVKADEEIEITEEEIQDSTFDLQLSLYHSNQEKDSLESMKRDTENDEPVSSVNEIENNAGIMIKISCPDCCDGVNSENKSCTDETLKNFSCPENCIHLNNNINKKEEESEFEFHSNNAIQEKLGTKKENHNEACLKFGNTKVGRVSAVKKDRNMQSMKQINGNKLSKTKQHECVDKKQNNGGRKLFNRKGISEVTETKSDSNIVRNKAKGNKENLDKNASLKILNSCVSGSDDKKLCVHKKQDRRPMSCEETTIKLNIQKRPVTAPAPGRRNCCMWEHARLPEYNGLHSEYGLSAEQLQERKRLKFEKLKLRKLKKQEKLAEEERKRKENEEKFAAWLAKKKEQSRIKSIQKTLYQYPSYSLSSFSAPINHLIKTGAIRRKQSGKKLGKTISIDKLLNNATPQEKRTYRIYLGLGTE